MGASTLLGSYLRAVPSELVGGFLYFGAPLLVAGSLIQFMLLGVRHGVRPVWMVALRVLVVQACAVVAAVVLWQRWPFSVRPMIGPLMLPLLAVEVFVVLWYLPRRGGRIDRG